MKTVKLMINGKLTDSYDNATFERRNPIDNVVATRAAAATVQDAVKAVASAEAAFSAWSRTGPGERRALLLDVACLLERKRDEIVAMLAAETGCSGHWAAFDVSAAVEMLQEAAATTTRIAGEIIPSNIPGNLSMGVRQPAGVVLGMAPWNAAVVLAVRAIAVPLACGNTVVLKGSEVCPGTHGLVAQTFHEAGFPAGVVNFITNAPETAAAVVNAMIAHPAVRRVNFTGSTHVGKIIAARCAESLTPVVLELGGKAPLLVLDDADLEAAVVAAAFGAFANSGQICMSTERIVVDRSIADDFVRRLAIKVGTLPLGDPRKGSVVLGSVVDMSTVRRCNRLIDDALAKGAALVCGGKSETTLMCATLLDHVTPDMDIYREESFGPVKAIVRVSSEDEAVQCANDNEFGLSAAVFSRDTARAINIANRIQSGICHINSSTVHDEPQMPFGGVKASGIGRFGGRAGIAEFTDLRWISLQTAARPYPF